MTPVVDPGETVFGCLVGAENKANIRNLENKINENHQTIITAVHDTLSEVKGLKKQLFEGNGTPPLTMKVDRNARWIKGVIVGSIPIYLGLVGLVFRLVWKWLTKS